MEFVESILERVDEGENFFVGAGKKVFLFDRSSDFQ